MVVSLLLWEPFCRVQADRARITSRTTRTKRMKLATIRKDISRVLKNVPTHYFTSPNFHCSRAIEQTSSRSNHPIIKWTAQLGIRCSPDKRVCSSTSWWSLKLIQKELGKSHTGQLDFTDSPRSKVRVFHSTTILSDRATKVRCIRSQALSKEINKLCQKRAIAPTTKDGTGFVSLVFGLHKTGEKWCPVINLKALNVYVVAPHFKMESV